MKPETPQPSRPTEAACPACGTIVKQVASASLELALWQHWNWACSRESEPPAAPAEGETAEGLSAEDLPWALDRVTRLRDSAFIDAAVYGPKLLKGHGYPDETFRAAQDARALAIMLAALTASREAQARQAEQIAKLEMERDEDREKFDRQITQLMREENRA